MLFGFLIFPLMFVLSYSDYNVQHIQCDKIVEQQLVLIGDNYVGEEWQYNTLIKNVGKNVLCGVVYMNTNKVAIIDKERDLLFSEDNIHLTNVTPHLKEEIIAKFKKHKIPFYIVDQLPRPSWVFVLLHYFLQVTYYLAIVYASYSFQAWIMYLLFGDSVRFKKKQTVEKEEKVMFSDVAGCEEAKYELQEVIQFLKEPEKFQEVGAKIPKGILLEGPPGTGKTLLAKATSNEADVTFIYASGSQFIEMYVGVGAQRVRKLFETANRNKPCIVFIDEIDAVGRKRSNEIGGNSEQDQTINQLLTIMDGFEENNQIIVMAATNRADMLDEALTRNGRFDRKIRINLPDRTGREQILRVHLEDKPLKKNTKLDTIYDLTVGMSGAQLANLVNEACILCVRYNMSHINEQCLLDAFEKITIGLPKKHDERPKENVKMVAYHEAGHTIGALYFQEMYDVRRVTINANNTGAGGYTLFTPKEEFVQFPTKRFLLANIIISLGGRAAEMIYLKSKENMEVDKFVFKGEMDLHITTGASNDLKQAHELARSYISTYGLGDHIGLYDPDENTYLKGKLSESSKQRIDKEIQNMIQKSLTIILKIIEKNKQQLESIADLLLHFKTIDGDMLNEKITLQKEDVYVNDFK